MRFRFFLFAAFFLRVSGVFSAPPDTAAGIAAALDDRALAAQVILTGIDGKAGLDPASAALLENIPAGGIMLFRYNLDTPKDGVKKLISRAVDTVTKTAGIPPFTAVDHEGGLVHRFGPGVEKPPSAFSFWELAQSEGRAAALARAELLYGRSAKEIRELGITLALGPVAEILDGGNRAFLDTRSYGSDPGFVEDAAKVFVKSMEAAGVACAVKHFPGNTASDPHSGTSTLFADRAALDEMVRPFAGIIRGARPCAVMVSHVTVPALDGRRNASLSSVVIKNWLREELGFDGITLADDFSMGAVAASGLDPEAAAVEALNAGVDMIMAWPENIRRIHAAILDALEGGRLSRERLREAAERIIAGKIRMGLVPVRPSGVPGQARGETP